MKKMKKSRNSNLKRSAPTPLVVVILLCLAFASTIQVFAQSRLGRPPSRNQLDGTPILTAGTSVIPDGTVLVIEMDTKLNSGTTQVSDQFMARVATPVIDAGGRTLLQSGTVIVGHVASVKKAKWGHRSGELGLSFDWVEFGDGKKIPIRGTLVSGSNPIDGEGELRAKSAARRDVLVTTGGAVAGAGIGMVTGTSLLIGGGAGAAAGLTLVLAMKGKNVDIDPGERFNLQLVQPMSLTGQRVGIGTRYGETGAIRRPIPLPTRGSGATRTLRPSGGISGSSSARASTTDPNSVRTPWSRVPIYDVRAQRDSAGMIRVEVTAETSTAGWRIYTNYEVQPRDTLDVRLVGIPPSQYGARQVSRPTAPAICIEDRNSEIRRIVVHGQNGDRYLTIGTGSTAAQLDPSGRSSSSSQPFPSPTERARPGPSDGSMGNIFTQPTPSNGATYDSTSTVSQLATRTANDLEVLRSNYAANVGLWMRGDGTGETFGDRRPTPTQQQLFDALTYLQNSTRTMAQTANDASNRQRAAQQLQRDTQRTEQLWQTVRSSSSAITRDLDGQWQRALNNLRSLISSASR
ncbi:MAG TPA: hypothetical protein VJ810_37850 [Blastocatellia bacterium]|nr:hypothetical protein [Blastocatellia bacterium]